MKKGERRLKKGESTLAILFLSTHQDQAVLFAAAATATAQHHSRLRMMTSLSSHQPLMLHELWLGGSGTNVDV